MLTLLCDVLTEPVVALVEPDVMLADAPPVDAKDADGPEVGTDDCCEEGGVQNPPDRVCTVQVVDVW